MSKNCGLFLSTIFLFFLTSPLLAQNKTINMRIDNPDTLIDTLSTQYVVEGIKLGLSQREVSQLLKNNNALMEENNERFPLQTGVYMINKDGSKGAQVMNLIWYSDSKNLESIAIFSSYSEQLTNNFRRLLTLEAVDKNSNFMKKFIGYANRIKTPVLQSNYIVKIYHYDDIGLAVVLTFSDGNKYVSFVLTTPEA